MSIEELCGAIKESIKDLDLDKLERLDVEYITEIIKKEKASN